MIKTKCLKWVQDQCVEWGIEDGKVTATINQEFCKPSTMKALKETMGKVDGFRISIQNKQKTRRVKER